MWTGGRLVMMVVGVAGTIAFSAASRHVYSGMADTLSACEL